MQLVVGTLAWMMVDVQRASRQRRELYRLYQYISREKKVLILYYRKPEKGVGD